MKIKNKRLHDYIYNNTSSAIRSRANQVQVIDFEFAQGHQWVSAKVRGSTGNKYSVDFQGVFSGELNSNCSCPYDDMCKHEVTVACEIDKYLENPKKINTPEKIIKEEKQQFSSTEPIEIPFKSKDDLADGKLLKLANATAKREFNYFRFDDVTIFSQEANNVCARIRPGYGRSEDVKVRIDTGKLLVLCTCNALNDSLCTHQVSALRYIAQKMPDAFMSDAELLKVKDEILKEYGFSTADPSYKNYFDFGYDRGAMVAIPLKKGIMRLSSFKDHAPLVADLFTADDALRDHLPFTPKQNISKKKGAAIAFYFKSMRYDDASVELIPLKGNLLKNGDGFASKIEKLNPGEIHANSNNFSKQDLDAIAKAFQISDTYLDDLRHDKNIGKDINHYILTQLQELLPLLKDTLTYEVRGIYDLGKRDLKPIKLSQKSSQLSFVIEEEDPFYTLIAYIKINGRNSKLADKDIGSNFLFVNSNNTYYLNRNYNYCKTLQSFKNHPEIRIKKEDFDNYYQEFILPLSKIYEVKNKGKRYETKDINGQKLKRQIYLSETENHIIFRPILDHNGQSIDIMGPQEVLEKDGETTFRLKRDKISERAFIQEIKDLHPNFEFQEDAFFYLSAEDFLKGNWFMDAFETLKAKEVEVFGFKDLKKLKYNPNRPVITTSVSSGQDWFDVNIDVSFGDLNVSLKDLKKAVLSKDQYVKLSDGSMGILPEAWLRKYAHLFRSGTVKKDKVEVSKYQLSVIDSLYDELEPSSPFAIQHAELRQKLRSFKSIEKVKVPKAIKASLRDYQKEGLNWLNFLDEYGFGGCLADDMGLGKTLQVITFLQHLKEEKKAKKPHLIVVPTSLIFNWHEELSKFCPSLKAKDHTGADRSKNKADLKGFDLIITTYGILLRDISFLKEQDFGYAILDESQSIKNPNSKRFKAVRMLKAENRLVLTGTPIENNTFDLYAQMTFINPGLLGNMTNFQKEYASPIDKDKNAMIADELRKLISPFLMRRTKEQVATELPTKTEQVLNCKMGKAQQKVYDAYRNKYRDYLMGKIEEEGVGKSKMYVLEGLTKLRQICDSPKLLSDGEGLSEESVKIDELMTQIKERTGNHKLLVFSQFVKMLQLIKIRLEEEKIPFEYLDGSTKNRQERVENFQENEEIRVFLISLKAGGTGLNLTAADYVYIVDPWWNPAVEAQAIDRCYRIGQDKKVMAYKMICQGTIEEKILDMQAKKKQLSADIVQTDESFVKSLDKKSIAALFGEG